MSSTWESSTVVAFDMETSGAYPLAHQIVEIGAVKWQNGQVVGEFQQLVKPTHVMSDFIIKIHGITNEMVADAPPIAEVLPRFYEFLGDSAIVAHHAPFDLGFLTNEFEKAGMPLPRGVPLCSSLLSRVLIPESENHRLQTLLTTLNLPKGTAHRALDDARGCLGVALECFRRVGAGKTFEEIAARMEKKIAWSNYLIRNSGDQRIIRIAEAIQTGQDLQVIYEGGSLKGITRRLTPIGLVRNPDGDFVYATCHVDRIDKRFYLNRISDFDVVRPLPVQLDLFKLS